MNGIYQLRGGKNWILPKEINANRFFCDCHWLESGKTTYVPQWDPLEGAWLWTQKYKGRSRRIDVNSTRKSATAGSTAAAQSTGT
jgi:hypothetical protein